ncbi:MAG: Dabb family protein [Balneolaceae bacterium]|nr:Dabb family protein [Balneolaceae bacterium]MBO6547172.1 Dabb family protein [Balneolaceae bacterium]MBO6647880.1 Dabb family protein [Balneolaceae bacterium]
MIKHIVMWKLLDEANGKPKQGNAEEFKSRLEALIPKIDAIKSMEVGIGYLEAEGAVFDMVLTTTHDSKEKLQEYAEHPEHQKVVAFAGGIVAERRVVDYEVN